MTRLWYLTHYPFASLVRQNEDSARVCVFAPDQPLRLADTAGEAALVLESGHVRIARPGDSGRQVTVEVVNPGEVIGSVLDDRPVDYSEDAYVMDECRGYLLPREVAVQRAAEAHLPPSDLRIRSGLRTHLAEMPVGPMLFQPLETRLASALLSLAGQFPQSPPSSELVCALASWQLADLICTNSSLVALTLDRWTDHGFVQRRGRKLVLRNSVRLWEAASPV